MDESTNEAFRKLLIARSHLTTVGVLAEMAICSMREAQKIFAAAESSEEVQKALPVWIDNVASHFELIQRLAQDRSDTLDAEALMHQVRQKFDRPKTEGAG